MRIMGLDFGSKTVGVAISDELLITAQGIEIIRRKEENKLRQTLARIEALIVEYNVTEIVLGYPKNMNGTKSKKTEKVDELIPKLEELGLKVHTWDERLTTVLAYRTMREMNISQKEKNRVADRFAATYILEGYLNMLSK